MARFNQERNTYILGIMSVAIFLSVLHITGILRPVEDVLRNLSQPFVRPFTGFFSGIQENTKTIVNLRSVIEENKQQQDKILSLESEISELKEVKSQNEILRKQLNFTKESNITTIPANVMSVNPTNFVKTITIDVGENDGIENGTAVVNDTGILIGRIIEINNTTATILLLTDSNSSIVGITQDSRATGTVKGNRGLALEITALPQEVEINENERIVTAGVEEGVPKGILIGQLNDLIENDNQLFKEAKVNSEVDFNNLEVVFVIK